MSSTSLASKWEKSIETICLTLTSNDEPKKSFKLFIGDEK